MAPVRRASARITPLELAALAAPGADVLGRLAAPALLGAAPLVVVVLSPSDPHMLLARFDPRVALIAVVFFMRVARAMAIFLAFESGVARIRKHSIRRLLTPQKATAWGRRSALAAVVFLPGMAGAVIAGRAGLPQRIYLPFLAASTAAGLVITLTAAVFVEDQLATASRALTSYPVPATAAIAVVCALAIRRRLKSPTGEVS